MKKAFLFAAAIALTMASCGNKTQQGTAAEGDSTAVENNEATTDGAATPLTGETQQTVEQITTQLQKAIEAKDSKAATTALTQLQTKYQELVNAGKLDEAKAYGEAIKKVVSDNAETLKNVASGNATVSSLIDGINSLPTAANTTAEQAQAAAKAISNAPAAVKEAAANAANEAVNNAKQAAKDKAAEEVQKASNKASNAVDNAKQKANEKVEEAKQKAANAAGAAAGKALKGLGL